MKTPETKDSTAVEFLQFVWDHVQETTGHSWLKLNHHMSDALSLAIKAGMKFDEDDWTSMERFRTGYWRYTENCYRDAVLYRNSSAWKAIEKRLKRKPFIVSGASLHVNTGDGPAGSGLARLIIGAEFQWDGNRRVTVTSINDDKGYVVACVYGNYAESIDPCPTCKRDRRNSYERKVTKQYKITHADLAAAKKAAKK